MSSKEVALATARFLDSDPARSLVRRRGSKAADLRRVAEAFYDGCFQGLGKKPRLLEEHDLLELMGRLLPASFTSKEDLAKEVPLIVEAIVEELEESEVVPHAFELRRCLDEAGQRFLAGLGSSKAVRSTAPVVNKVDKLGRNDPCFCGSGRKFKKCCGKPS